ncbi:hypothetical protein TorRG33x02_291010 [Trema orientale]|uniref:Uncharacterized protein n=1 Tax=Trema orientale TaxID=63057 RepID=A0A2P5CBS0_TREOI|nr:hypothetical protein TorRG33x02_291010 [Trema orientale]
MKSPWIRGSKREWCRCMSLDHNYGFEMVLSVPESLFMIAVGLLHLVKSTASKYFEVDWLEGDLSIEP